MVPGQVTSIECGVRVRPGEGAALLRSLTVKSSDMNASIPMIKVVNLRSHLCGCETNVQKFHNTQPSLGVGKFLMMSK